MKNQFKRAFPYSAEFTSKILSALREQAAAAFDATCRKTRFEAALDSLHNESGRTQRALVNEFKRAWYEKHPEYAEESEQGQSMVEKFFAASSPKNPRGDQSILRLMELLEQEIVPGQPVLMGDVAAKSHELTQLLIPSLVGEATVMFEGDRPSFQWKDKGQYAPDDITFRGDANTELRYGANGQLENLLHWCSCDLLGPKMNYNFKCDNLYAVAGEFQAVDDGREYNFYPAKMGAVASHVLLKAQWGGSASKLRGRKDTLALACCYFRKVCSQAGGEGCDYYVLPFTSLVLEDIMLGAIRQSEAEAEFYQKLLLLPDITESLQQTAALVEFTNETIAKMRERCLSNSCMDHTCVHAPILEPLDYDVGNMTESELLQYPLEAVRQAGDETKAYQAISNHLLSLKIQVATWEKFAPRYVELIPLIVDRMNGWLTVGADHATVYLTKQHEDGEGAVVATEFAFSEVQLGQCIRFLRDYIKMEEEAAIQNSAFLERLKKCSQQAE